MLFSIAQTYSLAALIIALVVILLLVIFKNVYYRRACKIEYLGFGIICVIYVALKLLVKQPIVKDIVSTVLLSTVAYDKSSHVLIKPWARAWL